MVKLDNIKKRHSLYIWGKLHKPTQLGHFTLGWSEFGDDMEQAGVYQRRKTKKGTIVVHMRYAWPKNPKTSTQQSWRQTFKEACEAWNALAPSEKEKYNNARSPAGISGFNRFVKEYLRDRSP